MTGDLAGRWCLIRTLGHWSLYKPSDTARLSNFLRSLPVPAWVRTDLGNAAERIGVLIERQLPPR